jgi:hypothetical protein
VGGERLVGSCSGVFVCVSRGGGGIAGGQGGWLLRPCSLSLSLSLSVSLSRASTLSSCCVCRGRARKWKGREIERVREGGRERANERERGPHTARATERGAGQKEPIYLYR